MAFYPNPNSVYKIVSVKDPNFCLDVSGTDNKRPLIIYKFHGGKNQMWRILQDNQGNYGFLNVEHGFTLEIPETSQGKEGTAIVASQPNGTLNEKWRIVPSQKGGFMIQASFNQKVCLDINGESMTNGNKVVLWFSENKPHQSWNFVPVN